MTSSVTVKEVSDDSQWIVTTQRAITLFGTRYGSGVLDMSGQQYMYTTGPVSIKNKFLDFILNKDHPLPTI